MQFNLKKIFVFTGGSNLFTIEYLCLYSYLHVDKNGILSFEGAKWKGDRYDNRISCEGLPVGNF